MKTVIPRSIISLAAAALLITGCTSQPKIEVTTDYSVANFDEFKSYQWLPKGLETEGEKADVDLANTLIVEGINKILNTKGYSQDLQAIPDFYVNYSVSTADKIIIDNNQTYEGYAPGFTWRRGYGAQATDAKVEVMETNIVEYLEGTLIIDIIDPENLHIIWRGMASKQIPEEFTRASAESLITNIVTATLENYPPPAEQPPAEHSLAK